MCYTDKKGVWYVSYDDIEIFLSVMEKKNLSKAASALFMSQSTLSHRLNSLEKELNVTLFERKKGQRTMELTPHGRQFIDIAERWLSLWKEMQRLQFNQENQVLYIGAVASLHQYLFPSVLHRIHRSQNPRVRLMIKSTQSSALYPALENHEIDVGFSVQPTMYSNINNHPILKEEEILVFRADQPTEEGVFGPDVHPRELNPCNEILFHYHPDYMHWHNYWWGYFSMVSIGIGDAFLLESFLDTPGCWTIIPMSLALAIQRRGSVSLHRLTNPPPERVCYMLTHRVPRPGKEHGFELLNTCMEEFLNEEAQKGHLIRM